MGRFAAIIRKHELKPRKRFDRSSQIADQQLERAEQIPFSRAVVNEPMRLVFFAQFTLIARNPRPNFLGISWELRHFISSRLLGVRHD